MAFIWTLDLTVKLTPKASNTFCMFSKRSLASTDKDLYKLSRLKPTSLAPC